MSIEGWPVLSVARSAHSGLPRRLNKDRLLFIRHCMKSITQTLHTEEPQPSIAMRRDFQAETPTLCLRRGILLLKMCIQKHMTHTQDPVTCTREPVTHAPGLMTRTQELVTPTHSVAGTHMAEDMTCTQNLMINTQKA